MIGQIISGIKFDWERPIRVLSPCFGDPKIHKETNYYKFIPHFVSKYLYPFPRLSKMMKHDFSTGTELYRNKDYLSVILTLFL